MKRFVLSVLVIFAMVAYAQDYTPVTQDMLYSDAAGEEWLTYRGGASGWGYSSLEQVNTDNVNGLRPVWTFSSGVTNGHEAPPIVHNGMMFVSAAYNKFFALDAATGDLVWTYERRLPEAALSVVCCDVVNRGFALHGDKAFVATIDGAVVALDAMTGKVVWETTVGDYTIAEIMTNAPLIADDKVIVGIHGGEFGVRGRLQALDPESGEILWTRHTVPAPGEPNSETWGGDAWETGGAAPWLTGTYDADTKTLYWGAGNPSPWMGTEGDKVGSDSMYALDVETGEIKALFQRTPDDRWDWDGTNEMILADIEIDGEMREAGLIADRNGYFYVLDRSDMSFIKADQFVTNNVFTGFEADGTPIKDPERVPDIGKQVFACPGFLGGRNWSSMAWNPDTQLMYIPSNEWCMNIKGIQIEYTAGQPFVGAEFEMLTVPGKDTVGKLQAFDPVAGETVWAIETNEPVWGGVLTTAGNLVFHGDLQRNFNAYNAETGDKLWSFRTNSGIVGVPSTYMIDGKQYVAVWSGYGGAIPLWGGPIIERVADVPQGGVLWVFALDDMIAASGE